MRPKIGDRDREASCFGYLRTLFRFVGQHDEAREYLKKALAIEIEISDRDGEATSYGNLGVLLLPLGQYDKTREGGVVKTLTYPRSWYCTEKNN